MNINIDKTLVTDMGASELNKYNWSITADDMTKDQFITELQGILDREKYRNIPMPEWFQNAIDRAWDEIRTSEDKTGTLLFVPDTDKISTSCIYEGSYKAFWECYQERLALVLANDGTKLDIRVGYGEEYEL